MAAAFWVGRRSAGRPTDPQPRRQLETALTAAARLEPRDAAEAFRDAWRAYLADRFALPREGSAELWRRGLAESSLEADARHRIEALLEEIEYLRHAPELSDVGHLREEILERSRRLARDLG